MERNLVGWFEIPVNDMERACSFYEAVFDISLTQTKSGDLHMATFPFVDGGFGAGGALVKHKKHYIPSSLGVVIYFGTNDMNKSLEAVTANGGDVVQKKKAVGPNQGFNGVFIDTEGNRIALHSTS